MKQRVESFINTMYLHLHLEGEFCELYVMLCSLMNNNTSYFIYSILRIESLTLCQKTIKRTDKSTVKCCIDERDR